MASGKIKKVKEKHLKKIDKKPDKFWKGVTSISPFAFANLDGLKSIDIPKEVYDIKNNSFEGCSNLESVKINSNNIHMEQDVFKGDHNIKRISVASNVIIDNLEKIFKDSVNTIEDIVVLDGVTRLKEETFDKLTSLKSVDIRSRVSVIDGNVFSKCSNLENVKLPVGLKIINDRAFSYCVNLKDIMFPEGIEKIGEGTFLENKSLEQIKLPESLKTIGANAFAQCSKLKTIKIPNGVENIEPYTFANCENLERIELPHDLKIVGNNAFAGCYNLKEVKIPATVESIGKGCFNKCSLEKIEFAEGTKNIDLGFLDYNSKVNEIKLPESIENISGYNDSFYHIAIGKNGEMVLSQYIYRNQYDNYDKVYSIDDIYSVFPDINMEFIIGNKKEFENKIKRIYELKNMGIVVPREMVTEYDDFEKLLYKTDYKVIKNLIKLMPEREQKNNLYELYKLASAMGVMEESTKMIKANGKDTPVRDVAYTVLQGAFKRGDLNFEDLHYRFSSMKLGQYNEEFLKFMSNKTNLSELKQEDEMQSGFTAKVYDWFDARKNMVINNEENNDLFQMTEEHRYKIQTYETVENGTDREKWKSPTVSLLKKEFSSKKFTGMVDERSKEIGEYLSEFNLYEQKHFNKALEIDKERIESGVQDHIVSEHIKEDIIDSLEDYKKRTQSLKEELINEIGETLKTQTDTASKIFTYEMLAKSDKANFSMGFLTSCCANLYNAGAGAQRAMITHPDMQPLVIRDIKGNIVSFGILYVNREEGYAVVNDFEVNKKYVGKDEERKEIYIKAMQGIEAFVSRYNKENSDKPLKIVTSGVSPNWVAINDFIKENPKSEILKAPNFDDFKYVGSGTWKGDWHNEQYVIFEDKVKEGNKR